MAVEPAIDLGAPDEDLVAVGRATSGAALTARRSPVFVRPLYSDAARSVR
jgi:hypothetical protein